jgi:hypothetical protein
MCTFPRCYGTRTRSRELSLLPELAVITRWHGSGSAFCCILRECPFMLGDRATPTSQVSPDTHSHHFVPRLKVLVISLARSGALLDSIKCSNHPGNRVISRPDYRPLFRCIQYLVLVKALSRGITETLCTKRTFLRHRQPSHQYRVLMGCGSGEHRALDKQTISSIAIDQERFILVIRLEPLEPAGSRAIVPFLHSIDFERQEPRGPVGVPRLVS